MVKKVQFEYKKLHDADTKDTKHVKFQVYKMKDGESQPMNINDLQSEYEKIKKIVNESGKLKVKKIYAKILFNVGHRIITEDKFNEESISEYYNNDIREPSDLTNEFFQLQFVVTCDKISEK